VVEIVDFRTVYFGPGSVLLVADLQFRDGIDTAAMDDRIMAIEDALRAANTDIDKIYIEPE
jgi:hypothetical protein